MAYTGAIIFVALLGCAHGQDANCDFYLNVQVGQTYNIYSPNYPNNYSRGVQCRWIANCPTGYNCRLDCPDVDIPQSAQCSEDRLLISRSGDGQLSDAQIYCGRSVFIAIVSTTQRIAVGLVSASNSPGGRFICQLRAQQVGVGGVVVGLLESVYKVLKWN